MVPVAFKDVTLEGKLAVGDVFLDTTLKDLTAKGALIITPEKVIVTTPGADNKKVL